MLSPAADAQEGNWVINWSATGRWRAPRVQPCWRGWVLIQIGWRNIRVAFVCIQDEWQWPLNKIRSLIFFNWNDVCNWKLKRPFTLQKKLLAGANLFLWISFFSNKLPMRVLGKVQRAAVGDATHTRERILRFWFQTDDLIYMFLAARENHSMPLPKQCVSPALNYMPHFCTLAAGHYFYSSTVRRLLILGVKKWNDLDTYYSLVGEKNRCVLPQCTCCFLSTLQGRLIELSATDDHPVANFHIDNPVLAAARDKNKRARFAQD
jgi:hypothetical protein